MTGFGVTESKIGFEKCVHNNPRETSLNNRCSSAQKIKKFNFTWSLTHSYTHWDKQDPWLPWNTHLSLKTCSLMETFSQFLGSIQILFFWENTFPCGKGLNSEFCNRSKGLLTLHFLFLIDLFSLLIYKELLVFSRRLICSPIALCFKKRQEPY